MVFPFISPREWVFLWREVLLPWVLWINKHPSHSPICLMCFHVRGVPDKRKIVFYHKSEISNDVNIKSNSIKWGSEALGMPAKWRELVLKMMIDWNILFTSSVGKNWICSLEPFLLRAGTVTTIRSRSVVLFSWKALAVGLIELEAMIFLSQQIKSGNARRVTPISKWTFLSDFPFHMDIIVIGSCSTSSPALRTKNNCRAWRIARDQAKFSWQPTAIAFATLGYINVLVRARKVAMEDVYVIEN